jgi:hypothetical protein
MAGWIKISREIPNHWIWKDAIKLKWWLDMLITVNFKDNKTLIGNQLFECKRGQSIMSLQSWADRWVVDKNKVRNFFVLLEKDGMILHENLSKTTRITICNYDTYQSIENVTETQPKRNQNATETQPNPIEEREERIKKENETINSPDGESSVDFKSLAEYWNLSFKNKNIPKIDKITPKRKKAVNTIVKEFGKEKIKEAVSMILNNEFFNGGSDNGWILTFDWLFITGNFTKVVEGNYNRNKTTINNNAIY